MSKRKNKKMENGQKPLYVVRKSIFAVFNIGWIIRFLLAIILCSGSIILCIFFPQISQSVPGMIFEVIDFAGGLIWVVALIWKLVRIKTFRLKVYKNKIVTTVGIVVKYEAVQELFLGITAVNMDQGFWANLYNYGDVRISCIGRPDIFVDHIVEPREFVRFMSKHFVNPQETRMLIYN